MKVHLVGGFSGSGKTTAIENAREILAGNNIRTSVFKDDKVDYTLPDIPSQNFEITPAKVSEGCGCCNFYQLYFQINSLKKESDISTVFAEYSGTCTNLITSLLKPLKETFSEDIELANFSTFTDAQLLLSYLKGEAMLLSAEDKYTWERHVLEAEILIVNKTDLLTEYDLEMLQALSRSVLSSKSILFQNSTSKDSINNWIEIINKHDPEHLKINDALPAGEVTDKLSLALLDEEIEFITSDKSAVRIVYDFMNSLTKDLSQRMLKIEDLHFFLSFNDKLIKVNSARLNDEATGSLTSEESDCVTLMVNARVYTTPEVLRSILFAVLNQFKTREGITINEKFISYFQS